MGLKEVIMIGIALAMDAAAISLSIGINCSVKRKTKINFILSFAIFQFLLSLIGALGGMLFEKYIVSIPNIIGGIIIAIVGIMMIKEGMSDEEQQCLLDSFKMYVILGLSVSIDALVVGFTALSYTKSFNILTINSLIIGIITLLICLVAFFISKYIRKIEFITKYADYIGGAILVLFGLKMIFIK